MRVDRRVDLAELTVDGTGDGFYVLLDPTGAMLLVWYDPADDEWKIVHLVTAERGEIADYKNYR